jgi:hypothetical protein
MTEATVSSAVPAARHETETQIFTAAEVLEAVLAAYGRSATIGTLPPSRSRCVKPESPPKWRG